MSKKSLEESVVGDEPEAEFTPAPKKAETVTVRLLTNATYDGRYLVFDTATLDAYLVGAEHLLYSMADQPLSKDVLQLAERPYSWDNEIEALSVSSAQIRLALYFSGHLVQEEMNFKKLVASLLMMGVLPILKNKESHNA